MSLKCQFENTNIVALHSRFFFQIAASVAEAAGINPKDTKTLLAKCLNMFSIKIKHDFSNGPRRLPKNPPNFIILDN